MAANDGWRRYRVAPEDAGRTVQEILTGPMGISRRMIQRLTRSRGILLNRRPPFLRRPVRDGDVVSARIEDPSWSTPSLPARPVPLSIVHEDEHILVIDKPAGLLVHPSSDRHRETLAHGVAHHLGSAGGAVRVRPVHRLDRETSGLVVFAKNAPAQLQMDRALREGRFEREYQAIVHGAVDGQEGVIDVPIGRARDDPAHRAVREGGKPARTGWEVLERFAGATLVRVRLDTGRTHQVRVHLAHFGHPVLGDAAYGDPARGGFPAPGRLALHAARLAFPHPSGGQPCDLAAPPPSDFAAILAGLGGGSGREGGAGRSDEPSQSDRDQGDGSVSSS